MNKKRAKKVHFHSPRFEASSIPSNSLPHLSRSARSQKSNKASLSVSGRNMLSASKSIDVSTVENEYIRNLQQQVYFLELECDYLRGQANKVQEIPNDITLEAGKLVKRLKIAQKEIRDRDSEILKRDDNINLLQHECENLTSKISILEDSFAAEKKELINEVVSLKKELERKELDQARKINENEKIKLDYDTTIVDLKESTSKINVTLAQLHEKTDEYNKLRVLYEEQRAECLKIQTEYQELEERFFNSKAKSMEDVGRSLKEEMKTLRFDLREKEIKVEQERTLRLKMSDDCAALVKENATLASQCSELQKHLDIERDYKHDKSLRNQTNIQELVTLKEERKHLERDLDRANQLLEIEKNKYTRLLDRFTNEEERHTRAKLHSSKLKAELEELEGLETVGTKENIALRRDKVLMSDEIASLQSKLEDKNDHVRTLQNKLSNLNVAYDELDHKHKTEFNLNSIRWDEFEKMADQMKSFTRSMSPIRQSLSNTSLGRRIQELDLDQDT
ncbi:protein hook homolog isoform X2 [Clytia hemisphaerica]|uniref:protein hook homolog isoform X2 n=1 Tax=Clytia hemisphaerica TaxID=252671 RepID=UPI0034D76819